MQCEVRQLVDAGLVSRKIGVEKLVLCSFYAARINSTRNAITNRFGTLQALAIQFSVFELAS